VFADEKELEACEADKRSRRGAVSIRARIKLNSIRNVVN